MDEVVDEPDGDWKFDVSEVGEESTDDGERADDDDGMAGVFGLRRTDEETLRRESIDLENALFVVAGVALTLFAVWQAIP